MAVYIKQIKIKNFRSIENLDLVVNPQMNIFVGLNDVGKSNVLKALNLFFNGETDYNRPFNFDTDFCNFANVRQKTAKEIRISILLHADGFKIDEMWFHKKWRKDSTPIQQPEHGKMQMCRLRSALDKMKYHYIPAVKGTDIFKTLLSQLYSAIPQKENHTLINAAKKFSDRIEEYTKSLTRNIYDEIGIESVINIPTDMQKMFEALTFNTTHDGRGVTLDFRGDGIKARHIPPLLKFISDSQRDADHKGKVNTNIIWGYEEPENGVEMLRCFDMANEFLKYSENFQMFITTHSPGFYSIANDTNENAPKTVDVFLVNKHDASTQINSKSTCDLNAEMGLMPLVTPYIKEKINEVAELQEKLKNYENRKLVLVSGDTDEKYFNAANKLFKILGPDVTIQNVAKNKNPHNRGGDETMTLCRKALMYMGKPYEKTLFVYDSDAKDVKSGKNVIKIKRVAAAPKYKIGIENLLNLPDNFEYDKYYQNLPNVGKYGESRQEFKKMSLCDDLIAMNNAKKQEIFKNFLPLLTEIKNKFDEM